jgi:flagellar protein FlbD
VILFTRLNRTPIALNPDLIERVEANPDTVITLVDDKKILVMETLEQVIELIIDFRSYVIARSQNLEIVHDPRPTLHLVPNELVVSKLDANHDLPGTDDRPESDDGPVSDEHPGGGSSLIDGVRSLLPDRRSN